MTFIGVVVKIFYCILLVSYWNDDSFSTYNIKESDEQNEAYKDEIQYEQELQPKIQENEKRCEENENQWDMTQIDDAQIGDAQLNQDADEKYLNYDAAADEDNDEELGANINLND